MEVYAKVYSFIKFSGPGHWTREDEDEVISWLTDPAFPSRTPNRDSKGGGRLGKLVKTLISGSRYLHERLRDFDAPIIFVDSQKALKDPNILACVQQLAQTALSKMEESVTVSDEPPAPTTYAHPRTYSAKWDALYAGDEKEKEMNRTIRESDLQLTPELLRTLQRKILYREGESRSVRKVHPTLVENWLNEPEGLNQVWTEDHVNYIVTWCQQDRCRLPSDKENREIRLSNLILNSCKLINTVIGNSLAIVQLEKELVDSKFAEDPDVLDCGNTIMMFAGREHKRITIVRTAIVVHLASRALTALDTIESDEDEHPAKRPTFEPDYEPESEDEGF